jgi:hypothetical protein
MDTLKDTIGILGGTLGAVAFLWKIWDTFSAYVRLDIKAEGVDNAIASDSAVTVLTAIENQGLMPKKVHYAALLIGPEPATLDEIAAAVITQVSLTRAVPASAARPIYALFEDRSCDAVYSADCRHGMIPLPFYFAEQRHVGNERVQYRVPLPIAQFHCEQALKVIFVVFLRYPLGLIRVRITSDLVRRPASR